MTNTTIIGIDLAKNIFHIVGINSVGRKSLSAKLKRSDLIDYFNTNIDKNITIGMEACGTCHYWGREFQKIGFKVRLLKPCDVKPYAKAKQKNDHNDALAIAKATNDPELKSVHVKSVEEQDISFIHNQRKNTIKERIKLSNNLRATLLERGYVAQTSKSKFVRQAEEEIQQAYKCGYLTDTYYNIAINQYVKLKELLEEEAELDKMIKKINKSSPKAKRLKTIPGIGEINASIISIMPMETYNSSRDFAASIGLVPSQNSSGGKTKLGRITKRGSKYARTMLIQGGKSILQKARKSKTTNDKLLVWANSLLERMSYNKASVAVANKLARICYAVVINETTYNLR